jgi:DNA-binding beta-propeller fold protein YncE
MNTWITVTIAAGAVLAGNQLRAECGAGSDGRIVVANRAAGTLSVIDTRLDAGPITLTMPAAAAAPEPMYVVYTPASRLMFVGDRANDRVVAFDIRDFSVAGVIPAGDGIWHMWANPAGTRMWVCNDIDKTVAVLDLQGLTPQTAFSIPADLLKVGGRPHDVIVDPNGAFAYVTVVGVLGDFDYVVKYDAATFLEIDRAAVGKDPHLSLTPANDLLYVPAQNANTVHVLHRATLDEVDAITVPGAHGAGMTSCGDVFYTTNISGGGADALWAIDTTLNDVIAKPVDAPHPTPHNLALVPDDSKIYVTHSGATNMWVSVYDLSRGPAAAALLTTVQVQANPFGLTFVPLASDLDNDGRVGSLDLASLLSAWGDCARGACPADIDADGEVDGFDLARLLADWSGG